MPLLSYKKTSSWWTSAEDLPSLAGSNSKKISFSPWPKTYFTSFFFANIELVSVRLVSPYLIVRRGGRGRRGGGGGAGGGGGGLLTSKVLILSVWNVCTCPGVPVLLSKPEINEKQFITVAPNTHEKIIRLYIPVYEVFGMNVFNASNHLISNH